MSPPVITGGIDPATGRRKKIAIKGTIALPLFRVLQHGKAVRGTLLDPFGYQTERRQERALITRYTHDLKTILSSLTRDNLSAAIALAELPDQIRGFGPVKDANRVKADARRSALLTALSSAEPLPIAAE
jgi:indolepyruvate ferredoxin oxidoreductase